MNMFDEAATLAGMLKMRGITQEELAKSLGTTQSYVANKLRLLKHTEEHKARITEANLTERHARALLRLEDERARGEALERIISRGLTVAQTEALIDLYYEAEAPRRVGRADKLNAIGIFRDGIRASVEHLLSMGVDARARTVYEQDKLYITISINEA